MFEGYEVRTVYNPVMNGVDVYLIKRIEGGYIRYLERDMVPWTEKTLEPGVYPSAGDIHPAFQFDMATLQSFAEALSKQGIRTDTDAKLQGTLDATERHLEDLRLLLGLVAQE